MSESRVVVYLGPSMPQSEAKLILEADYRPPIHRGDMDAAAPGTIVAIIDGVFEQDLSVSPREVREAVNRGVVVFGGSSMGALRAAEVPGVIGVGRVFEWYRDEVITRDDEVALLFDPLSGFALTVPTVSVRFAVERLCSLGTIDPEVGKALIEAAVETPYKNRTYEVILEAAGLAVREDSQDLIAMLKSHDIKYRDAQAVLEAIDSHLRSRESCSGVASAGSATPISAEDSVHCHDSTGRDVLIWESGDRATEDELYNFLCFTGTIEVHARAILTTLPFGDGRTNSTEHQATNAAAQEVFFNVAGRWGWKTSEEAKVTFADLGLDRVGVGERCAAVAMADAITLDLVRERSDEFRRALRVELFLNDLALKREVMRLGSLRYFAREARSSATPEELDEARMVLCKVNREFRFSSLSKRWTGMGLSDPNVYGTIIEQLALARRTGRDLACAMSGRCLSTAQAIGPSLPGFGLGPCPKQTGESRFTLPISIAHEHARQIGAAIGVTRVGMIGELADLGGVQIAQAARPGNAWSSSYGSGKSRTKEGAIVGSIMEETEKWAQEQFHPDEKAVVGSFKELRDDGLFVDPATLDLPYDSVYNDGLTLHWHRCFDLLGRKELFLPIDLLQMTSRKHDICYTRRGARKHLATNGLGSGFSREESVLHGLCEFVERHAQRIAELFLVNPGGIGDHPYRFVDPGTTSSHLRDLIDRLSYPSSTVRVLDITCEIRIPTFVATITRNLQRADGYGTHPDPETAIEMALLEAAQTIASATAGGREDLSIRARSLGRHERPRPISVPNAWFWLDPDYVNVSVDSIEGFSSTDIYEDLVWCLERIREAGLKHVLAANLTPPAIEPAHVVRVIVPGLETNNPFYTGPRARLTLLRDLLPKWR